MKFFLSTLFTLLVCISPTLYGQRYNWKQQRVSTRVISSAVPLMTIAPDARATAIGDVGVATEADINSAYWNVGKLSMVDQKYSIGFSYTPWINNRQLEVDLYYIASAYKINEKQTIGFSARLNDIYQKDNTAFGQKARSTEYYLSTSYSRLLSDNMSIGASLKYIHSNLISSVSVDTHPGTGVAMDIGWYWNKELNKKSNLAFGATITDIGSKITYSDDSHKQYIPTNLRLGSAYTYKLNSKNSFTFALDFNKLMVPTPPVYVVDENGAPVFDQNGDREISRGKDPNPSFLSGMLGSIYDAPGGINEEFQEIQMGSGIEYWYKDIVALRGGYSWEHFEKGDRKYFTTGIGLKFDIVGVDVSYLIPQSNDHPLKETIRFSAFIQLGKIQND